MINSFCFNFWHGIFREWWEHLHWSLWKYQCLFVAFIRDIWPVFNVWHGRLLVTLELKQKQINRNKEIEQNKWVTGMNDRWTWVSFGVAFLKKHWIIVFCSLSDWNIIVLHGILDTEDKLQVNKDFYFWQPSFCLSLKHHLASINGTINIFLRMVRKKTLSAENF